MTQQCTDKACGLGTVLWCRSVFLVTLVTVAGTPAPAGSQGQAKRVLRLGTRNSGARRQQLSWVTECHGRA